MPSPRQLRGTQAEDQAVSVLKQKGYEILAQHVTSQFGEIDILARDRETLVAVEVKYRANSRMGQAIESVTPTKIEKIYTVLEEYCARENIVSEKIRIDLVTIDAGRIDHVVGIF